MTVHQYHLLEWPLDGAAPASPEGMLALVRESRRHQEEAELEEGVIAVHSSCRWATVLVRNDAHIVPGMRTLSVKY